MADLELLLNARSAYESAFRSQGFDLDHLEEQLNDHDLQLSEHVFVANFENQRIQISLTEDEPPCAFIKTTGVDCEINLLQILITRENLLLEQCSKLFSSWIQNGSISEVTVDLASSFGH